MTPVQVISGIALLLSIAWGIGSGGYEPFITALIITVSLLAVEIPGKLRVKERQIELRAPDDLSRNWKHLQFSFFRGQYVNPRVIEELQGNLADADFPVVAINLTEANRSNRFHCDIELSEGEPHPIVSYQKNRSRFSYKYLGTSASGIHALRTAQSGGGSGIFHSVSLFALSLGESVSWTDSTFQRSDFVLLRVLANIPLGDRYDGKVTFDGTTLSIGPHERRSVSGEHTIILKLK